MSSELWCSHGNPLSESGDWSDPWLALSIWTGGENYQWITQLGHQTQTHYTPQMLVFCPRSEIVKMMLFNYRWHGRWSGSGRGYLRAGGWLCLVTHNSRQVWAGQTRPRPGWDQKYDRPLSAAIKTSAGPSSTLHRPCTARASHPLSS